MAYLFNCGGPCNCDFYSDQDIVTLSDSGNTDMKILQCFDNIKELYFRDNLVEQIKTYDNMLDLEILKLGDNRIRKIEKLNRLVKLIKLNLQWNNICKIEGLSKLVNLK